MRLVAVGSVLFERLRLLVLLVTVVVGGWWFGEWEKEKEGSRRWGFVSIIAYCFFFGIVGVFLCFFFIIV